MLYVERRDMFGIRADAYVHTANTVGAMGAGVAAVFRDRWPRYARYYRSDCARGALGPGAVHVWPGEGPEAPVITACTKGDWRHPSQLRWIEEIARKLREMDDVLMDEGIHVVSMPPLGCGKGGLRWPEVEEVLQDWLEDTLVTYVVCL